MKSMWSRWKPIAELDQKKTTTKKAMPKSGIALVRSISKYQNTVFVCCLVLQRLRQKTPQTFTLHFLFFFFSPVQIISSSMALKSWLSCSFHAAWWGVTRKMEKRLDSTPTIIGTEKSCQSSAATLFTLKDGKKKNPSAVQTWTLYSHHARSRQFTRAPQTPEAYSPTGHQTRRCMVQQLTKSNFKWWQMTRDRGLYLINPRWRRFVSVCQKRRPDMTQSRMTDGLVVGRTWWGISPKVIN